MFYRVVLQGRAAGDQDLATVKHEFARVTGLSEYVTEQLFAQAPRSIREGIAQADAERIAATLRAIGAAVTVERDLLASVESVRDGAHEILPPEHRGPPTVIPGSEPAAAPGAPTATERLGRRLRSYLPYLVGVPLAVVALVVVAPVISDALRSLVPAKVTTPLPVKSKQVAQAEPLEPPEPPNARVLHGPWRCTDQSTGLSTYWTFGTDGTLTYHGDTLQEAAARPGDPAIPVGWAFADGRLVFSYASAPPVAYAVADLDLRRLRYGDGKALDVQCRRP
jgi:hypothetical protein